MARDVIILCLLQEIKYLKRTLLRLPQLTYVGSIQFESTRPSARKATYSSVLPGPDAE